MNCCVVPFAIEGEVGVTAMLVSVAAVTVRLAVPETAPSVAEIVAEPVATAVARPREPAAFEMEATAAFDDAQVTVEVTSCVVPSE